MEKVETVRVPGQMIVLLQLNLCTERIENPSVCWINLYSMHLANIYLKAKFPPLQSAINPSPQELEYLVSAYSVHLTCVLLERM